MAFLEIRDLKVHYPIRGGIFNTIQDYVRAVDGVSLEIEEGKTYGLVGESGSGKSTIGKSIIGLEEITSGKVFYEGTDVTNKGRSRREAYKEYNRNVQMIFQDTTSALNPKKRIIDVIAEPIRNYFNLTPDQERNRVIELLNIVGMTEQSLYRYPHEFSGGQRQRIGVARAIAAEPKLIIADEPTSALDLSVQAQVLNYMKDIQDELGISYLFISHDLGVVEYMSDDIAIMHRGRFVERGPKQDIYENPQHIYTKRLLSAIPQMDPSTREASSTLRHKIEEEYQGNKQFYYDENKRVYELEQFNGEHYVAVKKVEEGVK